MNKNRDTNPESPEAELVREQRAKEMALATRTAGELAQPAQASASSALLAVLARASTDPSVDIGKMRELLTMQQQIIAEERRTAFQAALAKLAPELPRIGKTGKIIHEKNGEAKLISRYAKLEDIDAAIRPLLAKYGFAFSFDSQDKGAAGVEYSARLMHELGHSETKTITVARDTSGAKNAIQAVGSSTSYARRMLIKMHLNLIESDEDDDGNGGNVEPIKKEHAAEIAKLLEDARAAGLSGFHDERFLKWKQVDSFEQLLERDFEPVRKKIKELREREEAKR